MNIGIIVIIVIIILIIIGFIIYAYQQHNIIIEHININDYLPCLSDLHTHKIIWSYWDGSETPISVKIAKYTWHKHNPDYFICILSNNTLNQYLDISTFPKKYNQCSIQRKTDIIRLALLERYGGFWLDSTILLNESLDNKWDFNYDVGGYNAEFFTTDKNHPVLENWFLSAPKNNKLITAWKREFYKGVDSDNYDIFIKNMEKTIDLQYIDDKNYLMMHCCFLKVISKGKWHWKMFPAGCDNGPLEYLAKSNWNIFSAIHYLLTSKDEVPPVIKLRFPERLLMNKFVYYMNNKSIMHRLLF